VNTGATSYVFAGSRAMAVTYTSGWAGLSLHTPGFSTAPYNRLEFVLRPAKSSLPNIQVSLYNTSGQIIRRVDPRPYAAYAGNGWYRISIPLSDLGGVNTTITRVQLQENTGSSQRTFYVDSLRFVS